MASPDQIYTSAGSGNVQRPPPPPLYNDGKRPNAYRVVSSGGGGGSLPPPPGAGGPQRPPAPRIPPNVPPAYTAQQSPPGAGGNYAQPQHGAPAQYDPPYQPGYGAPPPAPMGYPPAQAAPAGHPTQAPPPLSDKDRKDIASFAAMFSVDQSRVQDVFLECNRNVDQIVTRLEAIAAEPKPARQAPPAVHAGIVSRGASRGVNPSSSRLLFGSPEAIEKLKGFLSNQVPEADIIDALNKHEGDAHAAASELLAMCPPAAPAPSGYGTRSGGVAAVGGQPGSPTGGAMSPDEWTNIQRQIQALQEHEQSHKVEALMREFPNVPQETLVNALVFTDDSVDNAIRYIRQTCSNAPRKIIKQRDGNVESVRDEFVSQFTGKAPQPRYDAAAIPVPGSRGGPPPLPQHEVAGAPIGSMPRDPQPNETVWTRQPSSSADAVAASPAPAPRPSVGHEICIGTDMEGIDATIGHLPPGGVSAQGGLPPPPPPPPTSTGTPAAAGTGGPGLPPPPPPPAGAGGAPPPPPPPPATAGAPGLPPPPPPPSGGAPPPPPPPPSGGGPPPPPPPPSKGAPPPPPSKGAPPPPPSKGAPPPPPSKGAPPPPPSKGAPPPPPPPGGKAPPPPPMGKGLPGAPGGAAAAALPPAKTKALFWSKLKAEDLEGSIWGIKGLIEDQDAILGEDERERLEDIFAKKPVKAADEKEEEEKPKGPQHNVNASRERNVGIVLKYIRLSIEIIGRSITNFDELTMDADTVSGLLSICPQPEDIKSIQPLVDEGITYEDKRLTAPIRYFLLAASIERFEMRLKCWMTKLQFAEVSDSLSERMEVFMDAATSLRQSEAFPVVLKYILVIGNHLNTGTQFRNAQGFRMADLKKLSSLKTSDNASTMMEYLVSLVSEKSPSAASFTQELSTVHVAARLDFAQLAGELQALRSRVTMCGNLVRVMQEDQKCVSFIGEFVARATPALDSLDARFVQVKEQINGLGPYFGEGKDCKVADLLTAISQFTKEYEAENRRQIQSLASPPSRGAGAGSRSASTVPQAAAPEEVRPITREQRLRDLSALL